MKAYLTALLLLMNFGLLTGCATANDKRTPGLDDFPNQTLPTGSVDAATAAAKTY